MMSAPAYPDMITGTWIVIQNVMSAGAMDLIADCSAKMPTLCASAIITNAEIAPARPKIRLRFRSSAISEMIAATNATMIIDS